MSARKTKNVLVHKLMFADDTAFVALNHQDAMKIITCFSKSAKAFRLKMNLPNYVCTNLLQDLMTLAKTYG